MQKIKFKSIKKYLFLYKFFIKHYAYVRIFRNKGHLVFIFIFGGSDAADRKNLPYCHKSSFSKKNCARSGRKGVLIVCLIFKIRHIVSFFVNFFESVELLKLWIYIIQFFDFISGFSFNFFSSLNSSFLVSESMLFMISFR